MRYLRLIGLFSKTSLLTELEYRANFLVQAMLSLTEIAGSVLTNVVFFAHTERIGGWRFDEALIVIGLFTLVMGIIRSVLEPNVRKVIDMVRDGTLDFTLLKPVNAQFMVSARHVKLTGLTNFVAGLVIIAIAIARLGVVPALPTLGLFALMLALALVMVYAIWLIMATTSFWFVRVGNLTELFNAVFDTGRFPISTFQGAVRTGLTFIVPVAFITTFPAQAVLGTLQMQYLLLAGLMAAAFFALASWFWRYAIRNYSSASS